MKSGTTTLFNDLREHPGVYAPLDKEPHALCDDAVLTQAGKADYAAFFTKARPDQLCGEASTGYTKLPQYPGVAQRAYDLLGPDLRLIYVVRDPIKRLISHHHHIHVEGKVGPDINEAVGSCSELLDVSHYAMQLQPWIDRFGRDHVLILRFEDMVRERQQTAELAWSFLGLDEAFTLRDPERVMNVSAHKPYHRGLWTRIRANGVYQRVLRRLIPMGVRRRLLRVVLPKAPATMSPPTAATVGVLAAALREDAGAIGRWMGKDGPAWDLDATGKELVAAVPDNAANSA